MKGLTGSHVSREVLNSLFLYIHGTISYIAAEGVCQMLLAVVRFTPSFGLRSRNTVMINTGEKSLKYKVCQQRIQVWQHSTCGYVGLFTHWMVHMNRKRLREGGQSPLWVEGV